MLKKSITYFIALVWLINGLFCKILNLVHRHQEIVGRILGHNFSVIFTKAIGVSEVLMVVWILSKIKPRWCAIFQIFIIATMNTIEFFAVPDILLFGHINAIVATLFIALIYFNEFHLEPTNL
jgi:hypothetical protein